MAIHHSTHPDYLGKSAIYDYRGGDGTVSAFNAVQRKRHTYGGVEAKRQSFARLKDPRQYLLDRAAILQRSRDEVATCDSSAPFTASAALDDLHSLLDWDDEDVFTPDVSKRSTLLALARMSSAAYEAPPDTPSWKPTPGFEDWNVSDSFGWIEDGIRGHVFSSGPDDDVVVVALKGTSAALFPGGDDTARRDKLNVRRGAARRAVMCFIR